MLFYRTLKFSLFAMPVLDFASIGTYIDLAVSWSFQWNRLGHCTTRETHATLRLILARLYVKIEHIL